MKQYFLQFDFWNSEINKSFFGVVSINLDKDDLKSIAKSIIGKEFPYIDPEKVEIKVKACNLV